MIQKTQAILETERDGKKFQFICDADSTLGAIHDSLLEIKGEIVDRMIKAQKQEEAISEAYKQQDCAECE